MTSVTAIFVGIIGAIISIFVNELLNKLEIDDVVGAVPVHLAAGIWGTIAVGLFSDLDKFKIPKLWLYNFHYFDYLYTDNGINNLSHK